MLGKLCLDAECPEHLDEFGADGRPAGARVDKAHQLHGDGGGATDGVPRLPVLHECPHDGKEIHAGMQVKIFVFRRNKGFPNGFGNVFERVVFPAQPFLQRAHLQQHAVPVVETRAVFALHELLKRGAGQQPQQDAEGKQGNEGGGAAFYYAAALSVQFHSTVQTFPLLRPKISLWYMHSAVADGVLYVPLRTARNRKSTCWNPVGK